MPKCSVCGKEWTIEDIRRTGRSGGVHFGIVHCPDCRDEYMEIITKFETLYLESKIYGKPLPDVDEYIAANREKITKLKVPEALVKWHILHRCWTTYELRR